MTTKNCRWIASVLCFTVLLVGASCNKQNAKKEIDPVCTLTFDEVSKRVGKNIAASILPGAVGVASTTDDALVWTFKGSKEYYENHSEVRNLYCKMQTAGKSDFLEVKVPTGVRYKYVVA